MLSRPKILRWWPLALCFVVDCVLLGTESELPINTTAHIVLQTAIVVSVYGLIALWCYIDENRRPVRKSPPPEVWEDWAQDVDNPDNNREFGTLIERNR